MIFTTWELEAINVSFTQQNRGGLIKDIRFLSNIQKKIAAKIPEQIERPTKLGENATEEEKTAHELKNKEWILKMDERSKVEIELDLNDMEIGIIANRVNTFPHYREEMKERLFALADKLGL